MATKEERLEEKRQALRTQVESYVRLVYRFPDGSEVEQFGWIYSNLTLNGEWIDLDILERVENRNAAIRTVYSCDPMTAYKP